MKQSLIILFSVIAFSAFGQNVNIKKLSIQDVGGVEYYVSADTTLEGQIIVRLTPVADQVALLADKLAQVEQEISSYDSRISELQNAKKDAQSRKKEIEKLQGKLQAAPKSTPPTATPQRVKKAKPTKQ